MADGGQRKKRVCVIGSGACGIGSVKSCLDAGFDVVAYEKTNFVGGLWKYHEEDVDGIASVMKSTIINSSKEMSALSDYPPPKEAPNYMHNSKMIKYLEEYAEKFNVPTHVKFEHQVLSVKMTDDHISSGQWVVEVKDMTTDHTFKETFDAVLVATGHHVTPLMPKFEGQEKFAGKILHSHSYKKPHEYQDKVAVVVGVGNSGGDIAAELGAVCRQTYLSTRRGTWMTRRVGDNGQPLDTQKLTRLFNLGFNWLPYSWTNSFYERDLNKFFDHEKYNLKPKHRAFAQHVMVNDTLPNRILSGMVVVKNNIVRFEPDGVLFHGDTEVTKCDLVVFATGYKFNFPFLGPELLKVENNQVNLYKYIFNPDLPYPETLPILGLIQPVGGGFPAGEAQIRWCIELLKGTFKLPSKEKMWEDIEADKLYRKWRFHEGEKHTVEVDWINYVDDVYSQIGAKPNLWWYFLTDFPLWVKLFFGPCLPYQFRLQGPGKWEGAREAIMTAQERIDYPLNTRKMVGNLVESNNNKKSTENNILFKLIAPIIGIISPIIFYFFNLKLKVD